MNHHHHHHRLKSWSELLSLSGRRTPTPDLSRSPSPPPPSAPDPTAALSDALLLRILSLLPSPLPASLVSRRWLRLTSSLRTSLTLLHFPSLPRIPRRFPHLTHLSLLPASLISSPSSPVLLSHSTITLNYDISSLDLHLKFISPRDIDNGLRILAHGLPCLRKLLIVAPDTETSTGLLEIGENCVVLQHLELHRCTDVALRSICALANLQVLCLVGCVEGVYDGPGVTDIGLTILAHGCKRLVKLELSGCEGSYDGISAVGRCCLMLEELTICDHRMDAGWLAAVAFCGNLKTLRLVRCRWIDVDPGLEEHLEACSTIELLEIEKCQVRDKRSLKALFIVCEAVREIAIRDCWGLDNEMFSIISNSRKVKSLSLEGCSRLTTEGFESVVLSWKDLQRLSVVSCNKIKDSEVTPALATLFSVLKGLKWRPNSKSVLGASLAETGMGKKGGRFFKRALRQRG